MALTTARPARCSRPRRSVKRPAAVAKPAPLQAVLLYEHYDRPYLRSMGENDEKYMLMAQLLPTVQSVAVHPILFLCPPQKNKYGGQCEAILQSPRVNGFKDIHTGLRVVPVPQAAKGLVDAVYVADYKPDYRVTGAAPAAVLLVGKPQGSRPGWMLLIVTGKSYRSNSRPVNTATAMATVGEVLPLLPKWLDRLPLEELQAA
jgi:hypothetical protein